MISTEGVLSSRGSVSGVQISNSKVRSELSRSPQLVRASDVMGKKNDEKETTSVVSNSRRSGSKYSQLAGGDSPPESLQRSISAEESTIKRKRQISKSILSGGGSNKQLLSVREPVVVRTHRLDPIKEEPIILPKPTETPPPRPERGCWEMSEKNQGLETEQQKVSLFDLTMTVSGSNPSHFKKNVTIKSAGRSMDLIPEHYRSRLSGAQNPFLKLSEQKPPHGKQESYMTENMEEEYEESEKVEERQSTRSNVMYAHQSYAQDRPGSKLSMVSRPSLSMSYGHRQIVSVLSFDKMLSFFSGVNYLEDDSRNSNLKLINSLHFSNMKGNADYCFHTAAKIDFKTLVIDSPFANGKIPASSSNIGNKYTPEIGCLLEDRAKIPLEYCQDLVDKYKLKSLNNLRSQLLFNKMNYPENIVQGKFATCSFAGALVAVSNHDCLFDTSILSQSLKIVGKQLQAQFFFNGLIRRSILLTKTLLETKPDHLANTHSEQQIVYGYSLLEKGMQILCDARDGRITSNMAVQLYHLTGWIPEVVHLTQISNTDFLWEMLKSNFGEGNIMLGFGVQDIPERELISLKEGGSFKKSSRTGLIQNHCYSVLIFMEEDNKEEGDGESKRQVQFKNPWARQSAKKEICEIETINKTEHSDDQGVFTLSWDTVLQQFQRISLIWNPSIYPHCETLHAAWKGTGPLPIGSIINDPIYCLLHFPQYIVRLAPQQHNSEIRILLQRHQSASLSDQNGIGVKLFSFENNRIAYTHSVIRTTKSSSQQVNSDVFVFEASRDYEQYVFVVFFDPVEPNIQINYSLSLYSFQKVEFAKIPQPVIGKRKYIQGNWGAQTDLGSVRSTAFLNSAQIRLTIEQRSSIRVCGECDQELKLQIMIISSDTSLEYTSLNLIESCIAPGFYYQRFSCLQTELDQGQYLIVLACKYKPKGEDANYRIYVEQEQGGKGIWEVEQFSEQKLPFKQIMKGQWNRYNTLGNEKDLSSSNFQAVYKNPSFIVYPEKPTDFTFHLRPLPKRTSNGLTFHKRDIPECGLIVAKVIESTKYYEIIHSSQIYEPRAFGCKSKVFQLDPNPQGYIIVCTTSKKGYQGSFELVIQSSHKAGILKNSIFNSCMGVKNILGKLGTVNSGGKFGGRSYFLNPQYLVRASEDGELIVELYTFQTLSIALHIFASQGLAIADMKPDMLTQPIAGGEYMNNCVVVKLPVKKGQLYTIVPSSAEKTDKSYFTLTLGSPNIAFDIKELPPKKYEANNKFNFNILLQGSAVKKEVKMTIYETCECRLHIFLQENQNLCIQNVTLRLEIFQISDEGFRGKIKDSGKWSGNGAFIKQKLMRNKNGYILVCSCYCEQKGEVALSLQLDYTPAEALQLLFL